MGWGRALGLAAPALGHEVGEELEEQHEVHFLAGLDLLPQQPMHLCVLPQPLHPASTDHGHPHTVQHSRTPLGRPVQQLGEHARALLAPLQHVQRLGVGQLVDELVDEAELGVLQRLERVVALRDLLVHALGVDGGVHLEAALAPAGHLLERVALGRLLLAALALGHGHLVGERPHVCDDLPFDVGREVVQRAEAVGHVEGVVVAVDAELDGVRVTDEDGGDGVVLHAVHALLVALAHDAAHLHPTSARPRSTGTRSAPCPRR